MNCNRCRKILINDEHRLSHECLPRTAELPGTLEEKKKLLYEYYNATFIENRRDVFERVLPAFTYEAMSEVGKSVAKLTEKTRAIHATGQQTKEEVDSNYERKHYTLIEQNEKKILEISKSLRCQNCDELPKFYCCKDGSFCSETCQKDNSHFLECHRTLRDPYKESAVPMVKRMPHLTF
uniref:MYND-type domain-containing protein n=1 Tax=Panagrolaimus davidi TaxID=227884 RepID=A0A914QYJ9_9BILA